MVSLDWLEVYARLVRPFPFWQGPRYDPNGKEQSLRWGDYKLVMHPYSTKQYIRAFDVLRVANGKTLTWATIQYMPRLSVMRTDSVHVKLHNSVLYCRDYFNILKRVLNDFGLMYLSVTRIDVAMDCNRMYGGKRVPSLLEGYAIKRDILKIGNNNPTVYYQSMGYMAQSVKGAEWADKNKTAPKINAITWGSKSSGVQVQIYNKSLELKEQKYKPYIVAAWREAGLDPNDVWRFEIRIQGKGKDLIDLSDNGLYGLGVCDFRDNEAVRELWYTYAAKYLRFVRKDYHAKKQQMEEYRICSYKVEPTYKPKFVASSMTGNQTTKVVYNYLNGVLDALREHRLPTPENFSLSNIKDIAQYCRTHLNEIATYNKDNVRKSAWYRMVQNSILWDKSFDETLGFLEMTEDERKLPIDEMIPDAARYRVKYQQNENSKVKPKDKFLSNH